MPEIVETYRIVGRKYRRDADDSIHPFPWTTPDLARAQHEAVVHRAVGARVERLDGGHWVPVEISYIATKHRAFGASSVSFGPFETLAELTAWCREHDLACSIVEVHPPDTDTATGAEVWR